MENSETADNDLKIDPVGYAVRELRSRLKLSQSAFGQRINRTSNTVIRYESLSPKGETLVPYAELALDTGFIDLFEILRAALIRDLGVDCLRVLSWKPNAQGIVVGEGQRPVVKAFLRFLTALDLPLPEELLRDGFKELLVKNFGGAEKGPEKQSISVPQPGDGKSCIRAARDLRSRLELTQSAFGARINRTLGTVMRYESQVAPKAEALVPYASLALDSGFEDLLTIFRTALIRDLGPGCERVLAWQAGSDSMVIPEELRSVVEAFVRFLSVPDLRPAEQVVKNGVTSLLLRAFISVGEKTRKQS